MEFIKKLIKPDDDEEQAEQLEEPVQQVQVRGRGTLLAQYELGEVLGEGAQGQVYKAKHRETG